MAAVDELENLLVRFRVGVDVAVKQGEGRVVRDLSKLRVEVDHGARRATDDGAVGVRASRRVDALALTFAVEVAWEDILLEESRRIGDELG